LIAIYEPEHTPSIDGGYSGMGIGANVTKAKYLSHKGAGVGRISSFALSTSEGELII
jgi:hypothetical protein